MSFSHLPPEQAECAERIYASLRDSVDDDLRKFAEVLASKPYGQLLGPTEFQVRDIAHRIGATAIRTALEERKKGGTKDPV